jgi:O-antigen/teichoic acid export membrane protein
VGVFFLLIIGFQNTLVSYFHVSLLLLLAIPLLCFFNLVIDLAFIILRNENQVKKVTLATIFRTLLELGTSVGFIILLLWGWQGRLYSLILATALVFVGGMVYLYKKYELSWQFDTAFLKKEWRYWMSSMVGFCFVIAYTSIDKFIIKNLCTPQELGDYSLATQFGFIILTFSNAAIAAYFPNLYKDLTEKKSQTQIYKKIAFLFGATFLIIILSILLAFLMMKYYVNERYAGAWKYYYLVALSYGLWSFISILYGFLHYFKLDKIFFTLGLLAIFILVPFQYFGALFYGIYGLILSQIIYFSTCFLILGTMLLRKINIFYISK